MQHTKTRILRAGAIALALGATAAGAAAQSVWVGTPFGALFKGDAKTGDFQFIGGGCGGCAGPVESLAYGAGTVFVGDVTGNIYKLDGETSAIGYAYTVPSDAKSLAVDGAALLVGGTDGNVLRVVAETGAPITTLPGLFGASVDAMALQGTSLAIGSANTFFGEGDATTGNFQLLGACGGSISAMARLGDELFLGDASGNVYRFSFAQGFFQYAYTLPAGIGAMVADGNHLLVGTTTGDVLRVNSFDGAILATFQIGLEISALAIGDPLADPGTAYCFGTSCPCGNTDALGGCANTTAHGALLRGSGSASVTADDLVLRTEFLPPNVLSRLYMSQTTNSMPFGDGLLCAGAGGYPAFRFPATSSGPGGVLVEGPGIAAFSAAQFGPAGTLAVGSTWNFQAWYRNPGGPCGSNFNTSSAWSVTMTN